VSTARALSIPGVRIQTVPAARNGAGGVVVFRRTRAGNYRGVGIRTDSCPGGGSWRCRSTPCRNRLAGSSGRCFRAFRAAVTGAGSAAGRIRGGSVGAKRGDLGPWRPARDRRGRLHLALNDFLLVRDGFLVHSAVAGARTPPRRDGSRSVDTDCCCCLCLQRSCVKGRDCGDSGRENPMP
jgi:hypothetical protein